MLYSGLCQFSALPHWDESNILVRMSPSNTTKLMPHTRVLSTLLLLVISGLFHSCVLTESTIDPQLDSVRTMRLGVESKWGEVGTSLQAVEAEVRGFSTNSIDPALFDIQLVTAALKAAGDRVTGREVDITEATLTISASDALELAIKRADKITGEEVKALFATGENILNTLRVELPGDVGDVITEAAGSVVKAGEEKLTATATLEFAERNPLTTKEKLAALRGTYAELEQELVGLEGIAEAVSRDAKGYGARIKELLVLFEKEL